MDTSHHWPALPQAAILEMTPQERGRDEKGDGVITIDQAGRLILCNDACVNYLGYGSAAEIVGTHAIIFLPVPDEALGETSISQHPLLSCARGEMGAAQLDGTFLRSDGSAIKVRYQVEPVWLDWSRRGAVCRFGVIEG